VWNFGEVPVCFGFGGEKEYDVFDLDQCEEVEPHDEIGAGAECLDRCMLQQFEDPASFREPYNPITNNCYDFASNALAICEAQCP
jgi:hypothetical protein